jgi:hypothetical protein
MKFPLGVADPSILHILLYLLDHRMLPTDNIELGN